MTSSDRDNSNARLAQIGVMWVVALGLMFFAFSRPTFAQSHWELTPYQIDVLVAIERSPQLPERMAIDLMTSLREKTESVIGPLWRATFQEASPDASWLILNEIDSLPDDLSELEKLQLITPEQLASDKVIFVGLRAEAHQYLVLAREFDCHTRRWGTPIEIEVRQSGMLADSLYRGLTRAFSPIAHIAFDADRRPVLEPRASAVAPTAEDFQLYQPGDVCLPVFRRNDRDGNPREEGGIQIPPRVYLVAEDFAPNGTIQCEVFAGHRNTLGVRRRGRIDLFALTVRPPQTSTRLLIRSRMDENVPLAGYEIYAKNQETDKFELIDVTNEEGALDIEPDSKPIRSLIVKSGGRNLGKFPILPGLTEETIAPIPSDDNRLEAEGELRGIEMEFLDLVVQRQVLIARITNRVDNGKHEEAAELLLQLEALPTRESFISQVDQIENQITSSDPIEDKQIKDMLRKSRTRLATFLDPREIDALRTKMKQAQRSGESQPQKPEA